MAVTEDKQARIDEQWLRYIVSPELLDKLDPRRSRATEELGLKAAAIAVTEPGRAQVIIEANLDHPRGRDFARKEIHRRIRDLQRQDKGVCLKPVDSSRHHVFAALTLEQIEWLTSRDRSSDGAARLIYKVWPDHELEPFLDRSVRLIKADACHRTFEAFGEGVVFAVIDSGIDSGHAHFQTFENLSLPRDKGRAERATDLLDHQDFTGGKSPLTDEFGHGTHVAGVLAGVSPAPGARPRRASLPRKIVRERSETGHIRTTVAPIERAISGVAPRCKLLSLKVLDGEGKGAESNLISALEYVARINAYGDWLRVHGVNISLGYPFRTPEWFAAGHSPLCVQVNRLVAMGVVVVVAAGNDGSAILKTEANTRRVGLDQSIADPGNAEQAITVGSTHPEEPLAYGVSYFSSKGPTADGRQKPDLIAPGERILSCASSQSAERLLEELEEPLPLSRRASHAYYRQDSGTSMAAPHVAGAIAAFISVRRELIGKPQVLKEILMRSATDLGRKRDFQGAGLIDLMRAMQAQTVTRGEGV